MSNGLYHQIPVLPWDRQAEDERRFRKINGGFLIAFVVVSLVLAGINVPEQQRDQAETLPPRLAKLVTERQQPPPPPEPEPTPTPEPTPAPEPTPEPKPVPEKPQEVVKEDKPEPPKPSAKERARAAIAVFDDLADLRDQTQLQKLDTRQEAMTGAGTTAKTERTLISRAGAGGSGGVSVSRASSGGGGSGSLAGVTTTQVESSLTDASSEVAKRAVSTGSTGTARRTTEEIQLVFDQHKGSIFSLYRRALRSNPTLEGTLVLRLIIQPDGSVSRCEVVSSQLKDADLERRIVLRIQQINFGARNVEVWNDTYPLNFIPS
jgi:outer membrane biosynthesis protein TonB